MLPSEWVNSLTEYRSRSHLLHYFLDASVVRAIPGLAAKPNDTAFRPPPGLDRADLSTSACSVIEHSEQTPTQPRSPVRTTAGGVRIVRLIGFHCVGFLTGFKEIIARRKRAWERVQLVKACVRVGPWATHPVEDPSAWAALPSCCSSGYHLGTRKR